MLPTKSLTAKILSINILALLIVIIGVLYIGRYQENLIDSELEQLTSQTQLFAGAVKESALGQSPGRSASGRFQSQNTTQEPDFILERARRLVDTLSDRSGHRIRLYNIQGELLADSSLRGRPGGYIEIEQLAPITQDTGPQNRLVTKLKSLLQQIPIAVDLPRPPDLDKESALSSPVLTDARNGQATSGAWSLEDGTILLGAAAPVRGEQDIRGVLFVSRDGQSITNAIVQERLEILQISGLAMLVTLLLSFYLAWQIGVPLRNLGQAAHRIRQGNQLAEIPVYNGRKDEIGTLSVALRDMTKALGDRLDSIEKFAGDVSHELKNPLSSMRSATETLQKYDRKNSPDPDREKLMKVLMHDIERMNRLITDISRSSRLDVALEREGRSVVDLKALLQDIITLQSQFNDTVKIEIDFSHEGDLTIRGNKDRMAQVLQNLIDNAVSFSTEGETIKVTAAKDKGWIVIRIEDTGPGIPDDKLEAIFDRFYSERPGHEDYGEHSGLGLAIARQIVQAHKGDIRAENIRDDKGNAPKGARFIIRLPEG